MAHFRRSRQNIPVTLPDGQDISVLFGAGDMASDGIEKRQVHESVRKLVESLPDEQCEVVVLRIYSDLSFKQISKLNGLSINSALDRMRYAFLNLRKMINDNQMALR